MSQRASASDRGKVNQVRGNQVNIFLSLSRLAAVMLGVAVALSWPSSGHSEDPGISGAPYVIETAAGELTTELDGAKRCITYNQANQALLTDCGEGESIWRMSRFSNGYTRFDMPSHNNICLGVSVSSDNIKVVGSWTCGDYNSAWRLETRSGRSHVISNQLAEEKDWQERCLAHEGRYLRLAVCEDTPALRWQFP
ncbi:hypothetical protein J7E96_07265 [Streptomyces sp. ISL-96]|uniref:hypothetical protein n=1 Tax=Streptomyces sp. ISL-96 TaxID=2819191 RepID=UPI001BE7E069|nr:hypothetical protein [Streptomyces sp. ISL-96]MBT2488324.1 hypothetical protein [Streptomyces sp. ISL-96]